MLGILWKAVQKWDLPRYLSESQLWISLLGTVLLKIGALLPSTPNFPSLLVFIAVHCVEVGMTHLAAKNISLWFQKQWYFPFSTFVGASLLPTMDPKEKTPGGIIRRESSGSVRFRHKRWIVFPCVQLHRGMPGLGLWVQNVAVI